MSAAETLPTDSQITAQPTRTSSIVTISSTGTPAADVQISSGPTRTSSIEEPQISCGKQPYKLSYFSLILKTIFFCFGSRPRYTWVFEPVEALNVLRFGSIGNKIFYQMPRAVKKEWKVLEPQIDDIIRCTPKASEAEPLPTVTLRGFVTTSPGKKPVPTVAINSSSATYAVRLQKAIKQSRSLGRSGFEVMIVTDIIRNTEKSITKEAAAEQLV